jgi:thiol-disulfide isomerase/thioredoxin
MKLQHVIIGSAVATCALLCVHGASGVETAGKKTDAAKVADFTSVNLTTHIYGKKITSKDLAGRVVLFEYWGINCPPCRASMPHLQDLYAKFGRTGKFVVLGSHSQPLNDGVAKFLAGQKVTFPVYQGVSLAAAPCPGGIPFAALVDYDGRVVATGFPGNLYGAVPALVRACPDPDSIVGPVRLEHFKELQNRMIPEKNNLESLVTPLRKKAEDKSDKTAEEAKLICDKFDQWLTSEKMGIRNDLEQRPSGALERIAGLKVSAPSVTEFDGKLAELKAMPAVQALAGVRKSLETIRERIERNGKLDSGSKDELTRIQKKLTGIAAAETSTPPVRNEAEALEKEAGEMLK